MCVEGWSWPEAAMEVWTAASVGGCGAAAMMPAAAARWATADLANSAAWVVRASAVAARWSACALGEFVSGVGYGCAWAAARWGWGGVGMSEGSQFSM